MHGLGKPLLMLSTLIGLTILALGQSGQSLGEVARQNRQQNQPKEAQDGQGPTSKRVFSDENNPASPSGPAGNRSDQTPIGTHRETSSSSRGTQNGKLSAEQWKAKILAAKSALSSTQQEIDGINASIRFASPTCTKECVQRNERAMAKEQQVERLRVHLEQQKKQLEDLQESARRQGYGNAVYDPN